MTSPTPRAGGQKPETPTLLMLLACYGLFGLVTYFHDALPVWLVVPIGAYCVALHSSLQHEALHGHPTGSALLNELLVLPALSLFVPYRRFRTTHLVHHHDEQLTDPALDPESWYRAPTDWRKQGPVIRALLTFNNTLLGRLLIGPALANTLCWARDLRAALAGDRAIVGALILHIPAVLLTLYWIVAICAMNPLFYAVFIAYPGLSLLSIRTFAEHRAHANPQARTIIVEASPIFSLLFLNNNLHVVHHLHPDLPWYTLPALYQADKKKYRTLNGGYVVEGYGALFRRHLLRPKEPVVHPLAGSSRSQTEPAA